MRSPTPLFLVPFTAALSVTPLLLVPGPAAAADCTTPTPDGFPLSTRIRGGPATYEAGGGDHTWFIDLRNTTAHPCGNIHPVVVLVDGKRLLRASQPQLEFFEGPRSSRPHPVTFERTDEDELVGAFDDGFPGFTVAPGRTLTVKVRLTLTSDTAANDVVANAAIVQRRGDDGDWVGESNDYRFRIVDDGAGGVVREERSARPSKAGELARTGPESPPGPSGGLLAGALLLAAGGVLFAVSRRVSRKTVPKSPLSRH